MLGIFLDILPFLLPVEYGMASQFDWPRDPMAGKNLACRRHIAPKEFPSALANGCAHRWLPCGSKLLITNPRSGKSQVCTVIDRGPYGAMHRGKWVVKLRKTDPGTWRGIVDLTPKLANKIEHNGMEPVVLQLLTMPKPR